MNQPPDFTGKAYWRSLERLLDSPAVRQELAREFPEGTADPPDGLTRRNLFQVMAASFALAGLAGCRRPVETIVPYVTAPEHLIPGLPKYYATTLPLGTEAWGVLVESHEGRPTKIEGNELHPASRGGASAWAQAAILGLYDPDRSPRVLRRREEGSGFEEATWEDFRTFWTQTAWKALASDGEGLAVLTESYSSPTLARLAARFRERFPRARWVVHEPLAEENVFRGLTLATGSPYRPVYHLERARTVLALDADVLLTEGESVRHGRDFARSRRVRGSGGEMSRLYVVECAFTVTGAAADHRLRLQRRWISGFAAVLARELQELGLPLGVPGELPLPPLPEDLQRKARILARDLAAAGPRALVLAGRAQPPAVHALALALNAALGAVGETVTLHEPRDAEWGDLQGLRELAAAMDRGEVSSLIILGGNPAYTAPADLQLPTALEKVSQVIQLSTHVDETSPFAAWHLPRSHFLEAWGDARGADGTASVIQPLIAPLFDSRSAVEVLGMLTTESDVRGYELVRETWLEEILGGEEFEARWRRVLHDGVLAGSALPPAAVTLLEGAVREAFETAVAGTPPAEDELEILFQPSPAVYDGRFANNAWLQELPDPITKLTWDNAALVAPETARGLQVKTGEVVTLELDGRTLEAPVVVLPGQAEGSMALALGYGRTAAGRVGNGVGVNAYLLRSSGAPYVAGGLRVTRTGRTYPLAQTQDHWEMEGRDLIRETTLEEYRVRPDFAREGDHGPEPQSLWREHDYSQGYQWGMAIDLNVCIGCNACVAACQAENNIPVVGKEQVRRNREMHWLRVDRYFAGGEDDPEVAFQPVPCMHCENAPCEQVCPVSATVHDREGLNAMVYNRCIGTRYCSNNCPYKVRRFNFFNYTKDLPELVQMAMNPDVTVRSRGVMEKCTYCVQRIQEGKIRAKKEGRTVRDGEIRTACQQTCPTQAIVFGNLNDPEAEVGRWKEEARNYVLLQHLYTKPRTSYLARLRNPNPEWEGV